jgi:hypothetical protein
LLLALGLEPSPSDVPMIGVGVSAAVMLATGAGLLPPLLSLPEGAPPPLELLPVEPVPPELVLPELVLPELVLPEPPVLLEPPPPVEPVVPPVPPLDDPPVVPPVEPLSGGSVLVNVSSVMLFSPIVTFVDRVAVLVPVRTGWFELTGKPFSSTTTNPGTAVIAETVMFGAAASVTVQVELNANVPTMTHEPLGTSTVSGTPVVGATGATVNENTVPGGINGGVVVTALQIFKVPRSAGTFSKVTTVSPAPSVTVTVRFASLAEPGTAFPVGLTMIPGDESPSQSTLVPGTTPSVTTTRVPAL